MTGIEKRSCPLASILTADSAGEDAPGSVEHCRAIVQPLGAA
jgi:hypothetical protein